MAGRIYTDENGFYNFDFRASLNATNSLNRIFNRSVASLLSDVDFVVELEETMLLVEYKNASIPGAARPEAFKPSEDRHIDKIARKFYDSLIFVWACGYNKPLKYIYILEYPLGDSVTRKIIRNKIKSKLPFELQKCREVKRQMIYSFEVVSLDEWNDDSMYSKFPIRPVEPMKDDG